MLRKTIITFVFVFLVLGYVITINVIADVIMEYDNLAAKFDNVSYYTIYGGFVIPSAFGDSVSVSVVRPRWYGTIEEVPGERADLYLFNFVRFPLNRNDFSYSLIHVASLSLLALLYILSLIFMKGGKKQHEKMDTHDTYSLS